MLEVEDFDAFVKAVHGFEPFGWQRDLLAAVHGDKGWPDLIDVPTGAGKTAALDIALFALALDAANEPEQQWASRRIVMVVDRRVVVDQTARHARRIVDAIRTSQHPVVAAVRQALLGLSGGRMPVRSATLRGGLVSDVGWARWPDVPTLISSTVDQVGSRLLFRGYGVSLGMRPVHAGLLGNDTLILLDEVHLSQPFAETLRAVRDRYQGEDGDVPANRWQVAELSATPSRSPQRVFRLNLETVRSDGQDAELARRLHARKPARLLLAKPKRGDVRSPVVAAAVTAVQELVREPHLRRIGVVVNRVATAHQVAADLRSLYGDDVHVLTGRMRPLDRDDRVQDVVAMFATGTRPDVSASTPSVLVATQCIEAGADLDLDALVTECASLDALRQRFGRVDRLGSMGAEAPAQGVIVAAAADVGPGQYDPVYGGALAATWDWLSMQVALDFGITALRPPEGDDLTPLLAGRDRAPVLRPGDLDRWIQTSPIPQPDPDPSLWLHGLDSRSTDVSVVWREDLTTEQLAGTAGREAAETRLRLVPPVTGEVATVPLSAVRRWLAEQDVVPVTDLEGADSATDDERDRSRWFLRWRAEDDVTVLAKPWEVRPGDTVVVPSAYGGYSEGGWDPASDTLVEDLAHRAYVEGRRRLLLRLDPLLWATPTVPPAPAGDESGGSGGERDRIAAWLTGLDVDEQPPWMRQAVRGLKPAGFRLRLSGSTYLVVGTKPLSGVTTTEPGVAESVDSEPESSVLIGVQVPLDDHLQAVGDLAGVLARQCGLHATLAGDLALAGRLHDLGKVDPRFQVCLYGGDEVAAAQRDVPLAKSGMPALDRQAWQDARTHSGYPAHMRHEMGSVAMIADNPELRAQADDWDLVLHLVASHHGYGRPFLPVVSDPASPRLQHAVGSVRTSGSQAHALAAVDSGVAERFWGVVRRYGWFRLAWFEAILRLADHRCSEREQERGSNDG